MIVFVSYGADKKHRFPSPREQVAAHIRSFGATVTPYSQQANVVVIPDDAQPGKLTAKYVRLSDFAEFWRQQQQAEVPEPEPQTPDYDELDAKLGQLQVALPEKHSVPEQLPALFTNVAFVHELMQFFERCDTNLIPDLYLPALKIVQELYSILPGEASTKPVQNLGEVRELWTQITLLKDPGSLIPRLKSSLVFLEVYLLNVFNDWAQRFRRQFNNGCANESPCDTACMPVGDGRCERKPVLVLMFDVVRAYCGAKESNSHEVMAVHERLSEMYSNLFGQRFQITEGRVCLDIMEMVSHFQKVLLAQRDWSRITNAQNFHEWQNLTSRDAATREKAMRDLASFVPKHNQLALDSMRLALELIDVMRSVKKDGLGNRFGA